MQVRLFQAWKFMKMRVDEVQQGSRVRWRVSARSSQVEHTGGSYIMGEHYTPSCFFFVSWASHRSFSWITFFLLPAPMCFVARFCTQKSYCLFILFLSVWKLVIHQNPGHQKKPRQECSEEQRVADGQNIEILLGDIRRSDTRRLVNTGD